ncbi:MAG TPA: phytoene/squalene synthase family protein [Bryobacteraceae bacterium]|jgi:phytoene synthase|nr:phytoene/squalene synthase family protein [Bryobacteraceae bacterium]
MITLEKSYAWCARVARTKAENFYPSFVLLTRDRHRSMCAIYAFMRYCDDLADDESIRDRRGSIAKWREDLDTALKGNPSDRPLWPAFLDTVARFGIPHKYFFEMIDGVTSDLEPRRVATFDELYRYCYHVASVVGLTIVHIYGFDGAQRERVLELAEKCGIAFQLTNILRDVREDTEKNRVYLPAEDLTRFGVTELTYGEKFRQLMEFEARRAREYYTESAPLVGLIDEESRGALRAIIGIYSRLLERIVEKDYDVLSKRVRVPTAEKLKIAARARKG